MAEEHEFQSQENLRLCVNNCGFFGSPTTQNMCSKCYGDIFVKTSLIQPNLPSSSTSLAAVHIKSAVVTSSNPTVEAVPNLTANRCSTCRKKVGLTGFRCRCGTTFCGTHRYPEKHGCTFDFKSMGRQAIAKANPLIRGEKLEKI